ncbi:hypothetical protein AB0M34_16630 [Nocardia sp. NPDC050193]
MSSYHQIFLKGSADGPALAEALTVITGCAPRKQVLSSGVSVQSFFFGHAVVDLEMFHEYEDDFGIPFSDYPVMITVRDLDSDKLREEATAKRLFDGLTARGNISGILVFDLQKLIGQHDRSCS